MFQAFGSQKLTCNQLQILLTNRQLWTEHVVWTRFFINSTVFDLPDQSVVTQRLLQNPTDFANELQPFYGKQTAMKFEQLLTDHLLIAAELVNAAIAGNAEEVEKQRELWFANAKEMAIFLAYINPFWSECEWQNLLFEHLQMTENEAVAIINGEYEESVKLFDLIEAQALRMADVMTCSVIDQFRIK